MTERTSKATGVSATPTGAHIWAGRFDGAIKNIFDLQNQVTASVVGAIALKMERAEIERARHTPTGAIRLSPFTGFASGHMFAGRCSEHDHDER